MKRDARASIGAYGGGNVAYYRVFTEQMRRKSHFAVKRNHFDIIKITLKTRRF